MIITLAGHVDHGKTSLVKALTGVDTDRLEEEKRRGLTIDLGFAYQREGEHTLGFVDVPGHHRFIGNMVAGVASMQYALLVVAADDGPMPQTREHLQILDLNGLTRGAVVITKTDRVDDPRLVEVESAIFGLVQGSFLQGVPVFRTSTASGEGVEDLRQALIVADQTTVESASDTQFRLAIDRAFNVAGSGVVVTGSVHAGEVALDDQLYLFPGNVPVRVRSLHAQNQPARRAHPGERCAINTAGISLDEVRRGHWLPAAPAIERRSFAMKLRVLSDFPRPVRHWLPVHAYHATAHATGRIALLTPGNIEPGGEAAVELVTDEPLTARHGDNIVLRDHSLDVTLGGGTVLTDLEDGDMRRRNSQRLATIAAFEHGRDVGSTIEQLLSNAPVKHAWLAQTLSLSEDALAAELAPFSPVQIEGYLIDPQRWQSWGDEIVTYTKTFVDEHPNASGARPNDYRIAASELFRPALFSELIEAKRLTTTSGAYHLPDHQAQLAPADEALLHKVGPLLDADQPPSLGDLSKTLRLPLAELETGLRRLAGQKALVGVTEKRFYLPDRLDALAVCVRDLNAAGPFNVRQFRDASGVGRNIAIDVLEYFDRRGFTRRNGDTRKIVGEL